MPHDVLMDAVPNPVDLLKDNGLRVTPQRIAILEFMNLNRIHATADEIYLALKKNFPSLSVATVYNTMRAFCEAGIVKELRFGDQASRFDLNTSVHHHLVCERCGSMVDVYLPELPVQQVAEEYGYLPASYHIEIRGLCPSCQAESSH